MTFAERKAKHRADVRAILNGPRTRVAVIPIPDRGCIHTRRGARVKAAF